MQAESCKTSTLNSVTIQPVVVEPYSVKVLKYYQEVTLDYCLLLQLRVSLCIYTQFPIQLPDMEEADCRKLADKQHLFLDLAASTSHLHTDSDSQFPCNSSVS
jgi:hypothetical protein